MPAKFGVLCKLHLPGLWVFCHHDYRIDMVDAADKKQKVYHVVNAVKSLQLTNTNGASFGNSGNEYWIFQSARRSDLLTATAWPTLPFANGYPSGKVGLYRRIDPIRAFVDHPFAWIKKRLNNRRARYRGGTSATGSTSRSQRSPPTSTGPFGSSR